MQRAVGGQIRGGPAGIGEIMNKERIYPARGYYAQTNPFHNRGNDRKTENNDENR